MHTACGTDLPADVATVTVHLAECPHVAPELAAWCRAIVSAVSDATDIETPPVSPETPAPSHETAPVSPETADETPQDAEALTPARMAELWDGDMSLRDIGVLAGVAPETVRRRIARWRAGQIGGGVS
ncbi:hypothetical protein GCM10027059_26150 [Myceligenerans halotolerans]